MHHLVVPVLLFKGLGLWALRTTRLSSPPLFKPRPLSPLRAPIISFLRDGTIISSRANHCNLTPLLFSFSIPRPRGFIGQTYLFFPKCFPSKRHYFNKLSDGFPSHDEVYWSGILWSWVYWVITGEGLLRRLGIFGTRGLTNRVIMIYFHWVTVDFYVKWGILCWGYFFIYLMHFVII